MKLKDKVFIITGISSGMGKAAAEQFTAEGAIVVGSVRKETDAQIWDDNDRVLPVLADVNHLDDIKRMVAVVKEKYGRLDGICNIAGINDLCYPLLETDDERWETVINTDLRAPFWIMREAMPLLIASGGGSIVNIGSYAALRGNHGPSYTAAKAGLEGLTKSVAFEFAKQNVRCNIIHPGGCATRLTMGGHPYHTAMQSMSAIMQAMPVNTFGQPEDIARACVFLCSDDAKWINGAVISIDGGMSVC
ncbi:MAG: SDR family oxidoreductase [Peptococcaceae bacterium]|nr:SDR family oxidoreductase [Peptococcaceae bacterium]